MSIKNVGRLLVQYLVAHQKTVKCDVRLYSRWSHRKPSKINLPFEPSSTVNLKKERVINLDTKVLNKSREIDGSKSTAPADETKNISIEKSEEVKEKREKKLKKRKFYLSQLKIFDDNNDIIYEKLKENDGKISTLVTNLKSKKDRSKSKQIMVEGWRMIVEGLEAKCMLRYLIFSRVEDLNNVRPFLPKTGVKLYKIPYKDIELWSNLETPPGIVGVFDMPSPENIQKLSKPLPLHLICDNVRVPGNLGAILRAAVGAGCEKVLLTKGCVDLWEPKVLRSAAGAHFRLPIHRAIDWEDMPRHLEEDTSIFIADSNATVADDSDQENVFDRNDLPVIPYYSIPFENLKHITLIIGGETEGISEESYRFAASRNGLRLNIPMQRGVDSLNTGMAAAVIAFEIRKQLIQYWTKLKLQKSIGQAT